MHLECQSLLTECADWLINVQAGLRLATMAKWLLPHPEPLRPPLEVTGIDPSTALVFITGARRGVHDALDTDDPAIYVAVVAQDFSTQWRELAGMYVGLCPCPPQRRGRVPAQDLLERLACVPIDEDELPAGARPREPWPHWFDERLICVAALSEPRNEWHRCAVTDLATDRAALIGYGGQLAGLPPLMLAQPAAVAGKLADLLPETVLVRYGDADELVRLAGGHGGNLPPLPAPLAVTRRSRAVPVGWCLISPRAPAAPDGPVAAGALGSAVGSLTPSAVTWLADHADVEAAYITFLPVMAGGLAIDAAVLVGTDLSA